jgi:hypothetical protein
MKSQFAIALLLLIFLLAGQTHSASPEPATVPANIEQAVRELGAADYRTRERASKLLWQADSAAEAALRKALVTNDPEVRERAMIILDKLAYRIGPNTPQAGRHCPIQSRRPRERHPATCHTGYAGNQIPAGHPKAPPG